MKTINQLMLKDIADKLMLEIKESQFDLLINDLHMLEIEMSLLDGIEGINEVSPMVFPFDVSNDILFDDIALPPLDKNDVLKNAREVEKDQIVIPKVI